MAVKWMAARTSSISRSVAIVICCSCCIYTIIICYFSLANTRLSGTRPNGCYEKLLLIHKQSMVRRGPFFWLFWATLG
jgi:hypothetical protein